MASITRYFLKDTNWKIDVKQLSGRSLQVFLLFFDKHGDFANKNEQIYNHNIQTFFITIGKTHQFFAAGVQATDIYPQLKKYLYKEHLNLTREELTTKF